MPLTMGLRFVRKDERRLRRFADHSRAEGNDEAFELFDKAADSAESGEPLLVLCKVPDEAHQTADAFTAAGFDRPAVEELSGSTPGG